MSDVIEYREVVAVDVVPDSPLEIEIGSGVPGPAGSSSAGYLHTQNTPSAVWTVQHGLGYEPSGVVVQDDEDNVVLGWNPQWSSGLVLILTFSTAMSGTARVS